nr:hypothetical protein L203_04955 [Cryptococcus depauperatus CBS 7841]
MPRYSDRQRLSRKIEYDIAKYVPYRPSGRRAKIDTPGGFKGTITRVLTGIWKLEDEMGSKERLISLQRGGMAAV